MWIATDYNTDTCLAAFLQGTTYKGWLNNSSNKSNLMWINCNFHHSRTKLVMFNRIKHHYSENIKLCANVFSNFVVKDWLSWLLHVSWHLSSGSVQSLKDAWRNHDNPSLTPNIAQYIGEIMVVPCLHYRKHQILSNMSSFAQL